MDEEHSILELSFQMGEILLRNGAEISRVQETMERVAQSYHAEKFNVYVLTNGIFAVGTEQGKERSVELRHIISTTTHMGRICAVNQLSREIAHGEHTVEEAFQILKGIREIPYSPLPLSILCCAVGSACFSFLFGGDGFDALCAFFCGLLLEPYLHWVEKHRMSKFLTNLSASALMAVCGAVLLSLGVGHNLDKVIIGAIIRLVPGMALTNAIRDLFHGDYLSGAIRMLDAILVGGCIAIGVGGVVKVLSLITGGGLL